MPRYNQVRERSQTAQPNKWVPNNLGPAYRGEMSTFFNRMFKDSIWLAAILGISISLHMINRQMEKALEWNPASHRVSDPVMSEKLAIRTLAGSRMQNPLGCFSFMAFQPANRHDAMALKWHYRVPMLFNDLPGHGASPERFTWEASRRAVQEISHEILQLPESNPNGYPKIDFFLIGHSLGGGLAIEAAQENTAVTGVIALSPAAVPVRRNSPPHLLILYGEYDFPFVQRGAAFLFEGTTGLTIHLPNGLHRWETPGGSHRMVVLEQTEHSGSLFLPQAYREIKGWISRTAENSALDFDSHPSPAARAAVKGLLCMAALAAWFPSFSLLSRALLTRPSQAEGAEEISLTTADPSKSPATGFQIYGAYAIFSFLTLIALKGFTMGAPPLGGFQRPITGMASGLEDSSVQAQNLVKNVLCGLADFCYLCCIRLH
jgi:pimeloyl-ACP methyl ester carboxylesterase